MKKTLALGMATIHDPDLLILDEPTAGLALGGREELVASLAELAADPPTRLWCW